MESLRAPIYFAEFCARFQLYQALLSNSSLKVDRLGHVNKISCFSSFCLQKFGEGGGYLLFIFRGQRSYATIFTGVKLGYKRRVKGKTGTTQVKKE